MPDYQVLARKYRPKIFREVFGQDPIVQTLKNAIKKGCTAHAYLFCGSRGTGKTTLARILAKALNCSSLTADTEPCNSCTSCRQIAAGSSLDVLEIDGASNRGIDDIKTIAESVGYCPAHGQWKIYIIDEVHMLTKEAFNALLKTLEEPPANVKFFFATTESHKVPATILSRCQRFNLKRLPLEAISEKLRMIASDMAITIDETALARIATFADGGLRDAESLFDQIIAFSEGSITKEAVQEVLGLIPHELFFDLDQAVASNDIRVAFNIAQKLFLEGKDLHHFLEELHAHFKTILLSKLGSEADPLRKEKYEASNKIYTQEQCLAILEMIAETQSNIKTAISEQIALESLLIKIVRVRLRVPLEHITRKLIQIEQSLIQLKEKPTAEPAKAEVKTHETPPASPQAPPPPAPAPAPRAMEAPPIMHEGRKKAHYDTLVQFASVELDATVQHKQKGK
ncbi:MAG: DNA polymerase III subunit gamma/tau [Verrucomicrobia bacterium]|nr:DNA polymerase III subunit gamma/tau [Verrucomicrobiota bacterium]